MSINGNSVGVIIPAYNEEENIRSTVEAVKGTGIVDNIVVVDDGSTDNTAKAACDAGCRVIRLKNNAGKAFAMKTGFKSVSEDIIAFIDADLGESASEVEKLIRGVAFGDCDAAVARFPMTKGKGGFGLVKALSAKGIRLLTGTEMKSVLSGQRVFKRDALKQQMFNYKGFGIEFGMTVDMLNSGIRIAEIDVSMKHRTTGRDLKGFIHRKRQFCDIAKVIIKKLISKG